LEGTLFHAILWQSKGPRGEAFEKNRGEESLQPSIEEEKEDNLLHEGKKESNIKGSAKGGDTRGGGEAHRPSLFKATRLIKIHGKGKPQTSMGGGKGRGRGLKRKR